MFYIVLSGKDEFKIFQHYMYFSSDRAAVGLYSDPLTALVLFVQGPVVQSIVSVTSLLVVKMLTILGRTLSNSQIFLLKKCE